MLNPLAWHDRFEQQTRWTQEVRRYLFQQIGLQEAQKVLEVGCGTGAVLSQKEPGELAVRYGLDLRLDFLQLAQHKAPSSPLTCGDAYHLPYQSAAFDLTYCHFLLLWLTEPGAALQEMRRVTRPGGFITVLAEPDYGGRIDYPPALEVLGRLQTQSLRQQSADPFTGRKLLAFLTQAGLVDAQAGVTGGYWKEPPADIDLDLEWKMLEHDLAGLLEVEELTRLHEADRLAWRNRERILYVPTFYAWGRVP
jgi:SAM-dependent methyltransferase